MWVKDNIVRFNVNRARRKGSEGTAHPFAVLIAPQVDAPMFGQLRQRHLGIAYLAAYLREKTGLDAEIIDANFLELPFEGIISRTPSLNPAVVGLSISIGNARNAAKIAQAVRRKCPQSYLIAGGYAPTFLPHEVLDHVPEIDATVIGWGERILAKLCQAIRGGEAPNGIPGLMTRKSRRRFAALELDAGVEEDEVESLPIPDINAEILEKCLQMGSITLTSSRGCPGHCSFCSVGRFCRMSGSTPWHGHPMEEVVAEMRHYHDRFGIRKFIFVDDNFLGPPSQTRDRALDLVRHIEAWGQKICFSFCARADVVEKSLFARMREVGLYAVYMGIESAAEGCLRRFRKGLRIDRVEQAIVCLTEMGIRVHAGFIAFEPRMTESDVHTNLDFISRYPQLFPVPLILSVIQPYPETRLYRELKEEGLLIPPSFALDIAEIKAQNRKVDRIIKLIPKLLDLYRSRYLNIFDEYRLYSRNLWLKRFSNQAPSGGKWQIWLEHEDIPARQSTVRVLRELLTLPLNTSEKETLADYAHRLEHCAKSLQGRIPTETEKGLRRAMRQS